MNVPPKAGRYTLTDELGRGAMGVVYRAQDPVIGRAVAVKTVRLDEQAAGMPHEELLRRFQTEARAAGRLTHPNIVVVYDAGEDDGLFYITMELVEGRSLHELLEKRAPFPLSLVLRIMQQACSALDFAHQNNVVHRDIKPANLMLTPDDTLKITDFGTAKILKYGTVQTAQVIGTPSYMSPEQVKGLPVDGRSDIFSLGVVLYELLTGEKPFPGDSITTVIYKIVNEDPVPPRELDSSIPAGLSAVITRALSKTPAGRFRTCREFMEALENYRDFEATAPALAQVSSAGKTQASGQRAHSAPPSVVSTGQRSPLLPKNPPPRQTGSVWLALVLLAIIGGAGYRVWPALQEVWQRGQAARSTAAVHATTTSQPAPPIPVASETPAILDPAVPPVNSVNAEPANEPEPVSANLAAQPSAESTLPPALPVAPKPATEDRPLAAAPHPSVSPAYKPPPDATRVDSSAAPVKENKPRQEMTGLIPTPAASRMQQRIETALVRTGISEKVQVTAVGNSVTLTGKLTPKAHSMLITWLQSAPTRVQIIDDIEYADDSAPSAPGENVIPF